ncbi:MAG: hypothetical protein A2283_12875 [Lentisphaerae bacterium RIFOXYA12_FULL_48_11]|nr:MAG: hypothetical protein A2283_12875 [Lentisphaerae bacterium RIFOXYA12_FULL_48_11]
MEKNLKIGILKILAISALVTFSIQSFSDNKADVDLWGNTGFVKAMPWAPEFHRENTFSFTDPHHSWINHEWFAEYIFNKVHNTWGNTGLLGVKLLLGLMIIALLANQVTKNCTTPILQFLFLALTISTMGYGFSIRPHLFTYLMLVLFLTLLKNHANKQPALLLLLPILGVIWTNLHGAFFIGIILLTVYVFSEYAKLLYNGRFNHQKSFALLLPSTCFLLIAVSLINPYGLQLWNFIIDSAVTPRTYLSEWAPFNPISGFWDHSDFMALSVLTLGSFFFSHRKKDPTWICILIMAFLSAIVLRRNIPVFAIVACYVVPEHIEDAFASRTRRLISILPKPLLITLLSFLIACSAWFTIKVNKINPLEIEVPQERYPVSIVSFIQQNNIKGNMFVFFDWAEYCIWKLYPDCRVFLDGRFTDAYRKETVTDYLNLLYTRKGWENTLQKYPIDIILIHKNNPSAKAISDLKEWKLLCESDVATLFLRENIYSNIAGKIPGEKPLRLERASSSFFP